MNIIFQNENYVIVDKPALVLTVPPRDPKDKRAVMGHILQDMLGAQVWPVHRLDYEVSGLVIFAKSKMAHKVANSWFETKTINKTYMAITETAENSVELQKKQIWKSKLVRGKKRTFEAPHGLDSETHATALDSFRMNEIPVLKWTLNPITGRSHQLRFELSKRGFPIIGDQLYGSHHEYHKPGIALRAMRLDLTSVKDTLGLPKIISIDD